MTYLRPLLTRARPALAAGVPLIALVVALVADARPCRADPAIAPSITWNVERLPEAASCPDATALAAAVARARSGDPARETESRDARRSGRAVALDVAFSRGPGGYAATLRARGATTGERTLADDGATCAPLAAAVVATVVVLLDTRGAGDADPAAASSPPPPAAAPAPTAASAPPAPPQEDEGEPFQALRLGLAATASFAHFHRSRSDPTTTDGGLVGFEARVQPYSRHGGLFAMSAGGAVFGPNATIIDAAYSLALTAPPRLRGVGLAMYLDLGPSFGIVSNAKPTADHTVFGGRASIAADLQISHFTIGALLAYRGGIPHGIDDRWEGALTAGLRAGVVFDFEPRAERGGGGPGGPSGPSAPAGKAP